MTERTAALVLPNLTLGGAERQAVDLALRLPSHGWRPVVLAAEKDGPLEGKLRAAGIPIYDLGAKFHLGKMNPAFWSNLGYTMGQIGAICRQEKAEVLQSFLYWQNQIAMPARRLAPGVKAAIAGRRNTAEFKDKRRHYQRIENFTNRFCDAIVCNSEEVRQDALRREKLREGVLRVIHNGVDADHFGEILPRPEGLPAGRVIVGTVGNMKRQKRHDLFLRTIHEARKDDPRIFGVIVGRDLGELESLTELRRELGLEEHVLLTGGVDDPAAYIQAFDIFLLTSDHEGMPNVVLEAMAAGTMVLTRRVGGVEEVVPEASLAHVTEESTPEGLARALRGALSLSEGDRERMIEAARRHVGTNFSMEAMTRRYVELYEELIGDRP